MSVSETEVGIIAFTDQLPGFNAILKHTWHDFHVNEIGLDGQVLHLASLQPEAKLDDESVPPPPTDTGFEEILGQLSQLVGEKDAEKLRIFKTDPSEQEHVQIGPVGDKQKRTVRFIIHEMFKTSIPGLPSVVTETIKEDDATFIRISPYAIAKKNTKFDKRNRMQGRNKSVFLFNFLDLIDSTMQLDAKGECCRYLHFVLYKENTDNQMAINMISKAIGVPPSVFRIAGTKDKRGITTQLVSGQNIDQKRLAHINTRLQRVKVGNFQPSNTNLYIGDLKGNQFEIILRDLRNTNQTSIDQACENLKCNGFLNYFGLQRFGQGYPTHLIGIALLKGDWKLAAHLILKPLPSDNEAMEKAKSLYFGGDIKGALDLLPSRSLPEKALLEGYLEFGLEQHLQSINKINRNTRTLYVHAYQSYVWNHVVSERVRLFGAKQVLEGDIVLQSHDQDDRKKTKDRCTSIHFINKEDLESGRYLIDDVVLPLPGASVEFPRNEMESIYQEIAQRDGVSLTKSKHKIKDFSIEKVSGDYRKIIVKVPELDYEIMNYHESYEQLLTSDLERLQKRGMEEINSSEIAMEANQKKRKMKNDGLEVEENEDRKRIKLESSSTCLTEKQALRLKFKLPASSYATMMIRQLTKYSTSKTAQIAITNKDKQENSC
eukprot:g7154.t1